MPCFRFCRLSPSPRRRRRLAGRARLPEGRNPSAGSVRLLRQKKQKPSSAYTAASSEVQKAQRRAQIGTSLRHWGHFCRAGSGGGSFFALCINALTGTTTKKKTAAAIVMNVKVLLMKS